MRQLAWIYTLKRSVTSFKNGSANARPGYYHLPEGLNVVGSVSTSGEIGQVELNLIPALVKSHGHSADEGLYTGG